MNTPTPDQREKALEAVIPYLKAGAIVPVDIETTSILLAGLEAALTAPPQVPQEVVDILKEAKDSAEKSRQWAGYTYLVVTIAKIEKALALLTQGRE